MAVRRFSDRDSGFSLLEVLVAVGMLAAAVVAVAHLFVLSARVNLGARRLSDASMLAAGKLEELRAEGELGPSPPAALEENTAGYVDYVDALGNTLDGGSLPPGAAVYTRRWSVEPLPENPADTLVLQVLVTPFRNRGDARDAGGSGPGRLPEEARVVTVRTRKVQ